MYIAQYVDRIIIHHTVSFYIEIPGSIPNGDTDLKVKYLDLSVRQPFIWRHDSSQLPKHRIYQIYVSQRTVHNIILV
jgi:hypothetical protein